MEGTSEAARWSLDLLSWPIGGQQTYEDPTTRFLSALTGGYLLGWGVMIWCLSGAVYDAATEGVRKAFLTGVLAWFFLDSAESTASGNVSNVLSNVLVLLSLVGRMWLPARSHLKG